MPTPTYPPLATITLSSSASGVTFSNIPTSSYKDLVLVVAGTVGSAAFCQLRFNSDSGSNYSQVRALGYSSGTVSDTSTTTSTERLAVIGTSQSTIIFNLMDFSATDKHKSVLARSMSGTAEVWMGASRWANTSAISSINVSTNTSTYNSGTSFSLYGIAG